MSSDLTLSTAELDTFEELWSYITMWTVACTSITYALAGMLGLRVLRDKKRYAWLPLATALLGSLNGFLTGAVSSCMLAAIYVAIPYPIGFDTAFGLGFGQAMLISYFQLGRSDYADESPVLT